MAKRSPSFGRKPPKRTSFCWACLLLFSLGVLTLLLFSLEITRVKFLTVFQSSSAEPALYEIIGLPLVKNGSISDVAALISAIRTARRKISGKHPIQDFTDTDRANWHNENPCTSRTELEPFYKRRRFVKHLKPNPKWNLVLKEYEKLHRVCIAQVGSNVTRYFLESNDSTGCKFAVAGGPSWAGLGNRVLPTLAVLLYAVLTQRVLLVPVKSRLPDVICEPFEGSSWKVDPMELFTPIETHEDLWMSYEQFNKVLDNATAGIHPKNRSSIYGLRVANWCQPDPQFFCDVEQACYNRVPWVYFTSCVHFLPKIFSIPRFRPVLEELFPDRMVATHLARSVMLPSDSVWRRVRHAERMYLANADRRVGIQMRYRDGTPQFDQYHHMVNTKLMQCALKNGILPEPQNNSANSTREELGSDHSTSIPESSANEPLDQEPHPFATAVFVTSLFQSMRDHLSDIYHRQPPPSGSRVGIYQLSHSSVQGFGIEEDEQALTEVMCLSFCDDLFVTPLSTFGGLAQAYGALIPWFLEFRNDSALPPCERGQTVDPCYQDPEKTFLCPHDNAATNLLTNSARSLSGKVVTEVVSYLKDCPAIDTPKGLQLITAFDHHHHPGHPFV